MHYSLSTMANHKDTHSADPLTADPVAVGAWLTAILSGRSETRDRILTLARRSGMSVSAVRSALVAGFRAETLTIVRGACSLSRTRMWG